MFIEHNIIMYKRTHTIKTLQIKSALHAAALYREHIYNRDSHGNFYIHGIRGKNEFPSIFFININLFMLHGFSTFLPVVSHIRNNKIYN